MNHVFARLEFVEVVEARSSRERGVSKVCLPLREHAVGLGDHEEGPPVRAVLRCRRGEFEAAGEVVDREDEVAALLRGGEMAFEPAAGSVEELGMVRFVCAEFGEAGEGRRLELSRGNASWRGIARVDESELVGAHLRCDRAWNRERVVVVLKREDCRAVGE